MTNQLQRVIDAIKEDPHGDVARNVCHWLAFIVMSWHLVRNKAGKVIAYMGTPVGDASEGWWQPLTDANHTRMLVRKVGVVYPHRHPCLQSESGGIYPLRPYDADDPTHDACQVLRKYHAEGTLTDETLEGFLND